MKKYYLSLIIPAYNEEKKIEKDINEAFRYFKNKKINAQVIVSTDGVTDKTNQIVLSLEKKFPGLSLITQKSKIGKGAAIKKGIAKASGKYIMFADAGLCIPYKFVETAIKTLEQGYDMALANREDAKTKIIIKQPLYRKIGSKVFSILIRSALGVPRNIKDTQCGFKIYRAEIAKKLFKNLQTEGMMFDLEHILRAKKLGYKIGTFPVEWTNDPDSKFNPYSGSIKNFREIYNIKFKFGL